MLIALVSFAHVKSILDSPVGNAINVFQASMVILITMEHVFWLSKHVHDVNKPKLVVYLIDRQLASERPYRIRCTARSPSGSAN